MTFMLALTASVAATALMLAVIHAGIWAREREARAHLGVSILAIGVAWFAWACLFMVQAQTPAAFTRAIRWANVPIFLMVCGIVVYVRYHFRTARLWLGYLACGLRLSTLIVNVMRPSGMDYASVVAMHPIQFAGDTLFVPDGVPSAWHWVGQASFAVLLSFVADAAWRLWRSGTPLERQRALAIGIPTAAFVLLGGGAAALILSGQVRWPHIEFVASLGLLCAISYELGSDVLRAARLSRELQVSEAALRESERRMSMAADAARLGMWIRNLGTGEIWLTDKCRELFAFPADAPVDYDAILARLHPEDRAIHAAAIRKAIGGGAPYRAEYRVVLPDGATRWIAAHGRVEGGVDGARARMLGVCIDITEQHNAEAAARELSGRLINAQEDERRRIARDLHDDLNQRLALLSVDMELLGRGQREPEASAQAERIASRVRELSSDVHRLSYQLHPAKLDQLGLVTAVRSWCRDVESQSGVQIQFASDHVPEDVPSDVALCLFRIVQEALRNVVRHSGAPAAHVGLACDGGTLQLVVVDGGHGFDPAAAAGQRGLGLVSMQERVRLLHGAIVVESSPGAGTRVVVQVPLPPGAGGSTHGRAVIHAARGR